MSQGAWVLDLDGVVWLSGEEIPGASAAVARLRERGIPVRFATNNSAPTPAQLVARLARVGIVAEESEVCSAAQAAASLVPEGASVLCIADGGVRHALATRGIEVVENDADVVIVGWTEQFTYDHLARASAAIRAGATFIATNADPTHPTPMGLRPGTGALIAAVAVAAGVEPIYAGKPHAALATLVQEGTPSIAWMVGDQVATDGEFAARLGVPFALVLSGVTTDPAPADLVAADLAEVVDRVLGDG